MKIVLLLGADCEKADLDILDYEFTSEEMSTIDGFNINPWIWYDFGNSDFTIL